MFFVLFLNIEYLLENLLLVLKILLVLSQPLNLIFNVKIFSLKFLPFIGRMRYTVDISHPLNGCELLNQIVSLGSLNFN